MRHNSDDIDPILRAVRLMDRFFREAIASFPALRPRNAALRWLYMTLLNEQLAPYALDLARALADLEDRMSLHRQHYLRLNGIRQQRRRRCDQRKRARRKREI